jgi:hypothetical protein
MTETTDTQTEQIPPPLGFRLKINDVLRPKIGRPVRDDEMCALWAAYSDLDAFAAAFAAIVDREQRHAPMWLNPAPHVEALSGVVRREAAREFDFVWLAGGRYDVRLV